MLLVTEVKGVGRKMEFLNGLRIRRRYSELKEEDWRKCKLHFITGTDIRFIFHESMVLITRIITIIIITIIILM